MGDDDPTPKTGSDIAEFAKSIANDLNGGSDVSVGFECPLFVPIPKDPLDLTSQRDGECGRPWSAGAGMGSLATGLTETVWILEAIRESLHRDHPAFLDWSLFRSAGEGLFIWEAFVTGKSKTGTDKGDAERAVTYFRECLPNPTKHDAIRSCRVRSLIGAALIQTGWTTDISLLGESCLVIKP